MCSDDDSSNVVDLRQARAERDTRVCELRARLVIEWRGSGYLLMYDDYENNPANEDWLWCELCSILEGKGYIVPTEDKVADNEQR